MELLKEFFADPMNIFAALESEQSLMLLALSALLYVLGMWTGWLIWGRLARRRMKMVRKLESDLNALNTEYTVLDGKYQQLMEEQETLFKEKEEVGSQLANSERERQALNNQLLVAKDENIMLQTDMDTYLKKIDSLDTQMISLTTKNAQLEEELEMTGDTMNSLAAVQSSFNSTKDRLTIVESRIGDLMNENQDLRIELSKMNDNIPPVVPTIPVGVVSKEVEEIMPQQETPVDTVVKEVEEQKKEEDEFDAAEKDTAEEIETRDISTIDARLAVQKAIGGKISMASIDEKDDLQVINGVGTYIENQLNELGIYTFEQICQWDNEFIELITAAIEFFPGRIQKDDWKGQACQLKKGDKKKPADYDKKDADIISVETYTSSVPSEAPTLTHSTNKIVDTPKTITEKVTLSSIIMPEGVKGPHDLQVIEGIGPKIEKILKDAGIKNWQTLADTETTYLKEILMTASGRYRLVVPDTWPKQAALAASGQWDELKTYQDLLDGGKEIKK